MPEPIDIHCTRCNQVIVPHDHMMPLSHFQTGERNASGLFVAKITNINVAVNADWICPNCGRMVYQRLNEQRLDLLLRNSKHA